MATESSTATSLRAVVMLTCLVAIPAVAIFGGGLPLWVQSRLPWLAQNQDTSADETAPGNQASVLPADPRFAGQNPPRSQPGATPGQRGATPGGIQYPRSSLPAPGNTTQRLPDLAGAGRAATNPPGRVPPVGSATSLPLARPGQEDNAPTPGGVVPAGYVAPLGGPSPPREAANSPTSHRPTSDRPTDRFSEIGQRLRRLGATYVLLETLGNDMQTYRFLCMMALGGDPSCTRLFEATSSSPLQAMDRVLAEVEAWKAARPQ